MTKSAIICLSAVFAVGCGNTNSQQVQKTTPPASEPQRSEKLQTTTAHTTENQPQKVLNSDGTPGSNSKWSQGGEAIDTAKFDGVIAAAEKTIKSKPDAEAKKTLAQAYFDRGFALTEARQYASALGDYRRALKNDPSHEDSQKWIDQIISIYSMLKKNYPKEGEEPPPLPFKK